MHDDKGFILQQVELDTAPMLKCESCGDIIRDFGMAWVMWENHKLKNGESVKPTVLCKTNGCNSKPPYVGFASMEMRDYLIDLFRNLGVRTKKQLLEALEFSEMMHSI